MLAERKRKLKKKFKKRKRAAKRSDEEDEDYVEEKKKRTKAKEEEEKKIRKIKKKKAPWENVNKEFSKYSSGSDGSGLEDEDLEDLAGLYHEVEEDLLFKSDHEFSCESDGSEEVEVKHARTGAAKKRRR